MPDSRQGASAKIAEKADDRAAHSGRLAQQAGHHHAVHQGHPGAHVACVLEKRARFLELRLRHVPDADHRGQRIGRAETCAVGRLALDAQRVGPGEPTAAAHRPGVEQQARDESLARGGAAQHHHLAGQQGAAGLDLGHGAALEPCALEDDGLLRQPVEGGVLAHAHGDVDGAMAAAPGGAVDLLGRLGGRDGGRLWANFDRHFQRIAVGPPARGGQQDGLRRFAQLGRREQNPAGIALIEIAQPRLAVPQVEGDTAFAGGALQAGGYGGHRHPLDRLGTEMSKAFTKESDGDDEDDLPEDVGGLPVSAKNYMTPEGFARLREELNTLMRKERPDVVKVVSWAAGNGDRSENGDYIYGKKRLREIDRRVRYLSKRLANAEVVDPARRAKTDQVFFGATVTTANARNEERTLKIVGVDEVDLSKGHVSWISPIAKALLKAEEGDVVKMRTPTGVEELEIVKVRYV